MLEELQSREVKGLEIDQELRTRLDKIPLYVQKLKDLECRKQQLEARIHRIKEEVRKTSI